MLLVFNKNIDLNNNGIYIGRGSKWGNPYSHIPNSKADFITDTREEAINAYQYYILIDKPQLFYDAKIELKNSNLSCFCHPLSCHGDFLIEIANSEENISFFKKKYLNI